MAYAADDPVPDLGKRIYESKCATCHGLSGKGDGPFAANLTTKPSDLTTIARSNNGVMPVKRLEAVIDGRMMVNSHGPREMPIWGQEFSTEAGADWPVYMGIPFNPNVIVRSRVMALIDYIARLQVK